MSDSQLQNAHTVASQLQIAPEQLRHWTQEFSAQLSAAAVSTGFYRYTADDVKRLQAIKEMMAEGKSSAEVSQQLGDAPDNSAEPLPTAMVIQADDVKRNGDSGLLLRDMLSGFAAGQEAILNSQQTNRNLMGVVVQDNFNLKEENAKLRERMLKLEQELGDVRRSQSEYRQQVEQRLRLMEHRRDWVSRLFGF